MSVYNQQDSHQKYHDQTNFSFKQNQTKLTIKPKQSSSMIGKQKSNNKLKSKSQINIRKAPLFLQLNQQLNHLKYKVQTSKDILTTIYSKVKTKESILQNQLSKQNLQLYKANQVAQNYKKMYTDGLKLVQSCIDKRHSQNIKKNQNVLNTNKLVQLKINALQKIKQKRKFQQNINHDKLKYQVKETQKNQQKADIQSNASQSYLYQHKNIPKEANNDITNKMKKSHSVINTTNKKFISDKQKKLNPKSKHSISQSQIQQTHHKKPQQKILTFKQKQKQSQKQSMQKSMIRTERQKQKVQDQKTLYEIYKQRIQKRQKQLNSQKMSWIVDKLKQNIDDLQLIRKKSQIKLQKHSKSKSIQTQKQPKINEKSPQQLQIRKQKSKQKYLEIQKSKLRSINQSLA